MVTSGTPSLENLLVTRCVATHNADRHFQSARSTVRVSLREEQLVFTASVRRWLAIGFVASLVAAVPSLAIANHSWGGYHWARTSNPFTLLVGDNVSSAWDSYLDEAIADWSVSSVLDLQETAGGTRAKPCKATVGRIEACSASYGNNGWLGIAQIWISGGEHITKALTKVNDYYFNQPTYNTPAWRRLVMCQEIAHDFGLDHQDENFNNANLGSCMDYTSDPDGPPSNEHPNSHDYEQLETIYSHLDSFSTVGGTSASALSGSDWGHLASGSRAGGYSVYVKADGHGNAVITHVIWAR
jgi:hypothetical protein